MDRIIHKSRPWRERRPPSILGDNNNLSIIGSIGRIIKIKIGALQGKIDSMQIASLFEPDIIGYHKYFPSVLAPACICLIHAGNYGFTEICIFYAIQNFE